MLSQRLVKHRYGVIAVALAVLLVAGCATSPTPLAQAVEVPPARRFPFPPAGAAAGTVTIVRDGGFTGSGCYLDLHVNRTRVARIAPGERIDVAVSAGEVLLRTGRDPDGSGLCAASSSGDWRQRETQIKPGERKVFRVMMGTSFEVDIVRAAAD